MRKPRDIDAELKILQDRARDLKSRRITQLGELVVATGADGLPLEALAGALLAAVEQAKSAPDMVARWTETGGAFFRAGQRKQATRRNGAGEGQAAGDAPGAANAPSGTPQPGSTPAQDGGPLI